jgi:hypothetical protein
MWGHTPHFSSFLPLLLHTSVTVAGLRRFETSGQFTPHRPGTKKAPAMNRGFTFSHQAE